MSGQPIPNGGEFVSTSDFLELEARMESIEQLNKVQQETLDTINTNTTELLDTFNALKGAWKVLDFIGKLAKPIGVVVALVGGWFTIKGMK